MNKLHLCFCVGFFATLCSINAHAQQTNSASKPIISSITPQQGPIGTKIYIHGSGLKPAPLSSNLLLFDGKRATTLMMDPLNGDTLITFQIANFADIDGCDRLRSNPLHALDTCTPGPLPIEPGQHTFSIQNGTLTSNSIAFTVTPYEGTASIDSFVSSSDDPIVTGTASKVSNIDIFCVCGGLSIFTTRSTPVTNGHWSLHLTDPYQGRPGAVPVPRSGTYQLEVHDSDTNMLLTKGSFTITK